MISSSRDTESQISRKSDDLVLILSRSKHVKSTVDQAVKTMYETLYPVTSEDLINAQENHHGRRLIQSMKKLVPGILSSEDDEFQTQENRKMNFCQYSIQLEQLLVSSLILLDCLMSINSGIPSFQKTFMSEFKVMLNKLAIFTTLALECPLWTMKCFYPLALFMRAILVIIWKGISMWVPAIFLMTSSVRSLCMTLLNMFISVEIRCLFRQFLMVSISWVHWQTQAGNFTMRAIAAKCLTLLRMDCILTSIFL